MATQKITEVPSAETFDTLLAIRDIGGGVLEGPVKVTKETVRQAVTGSAGFAARAKLEGNTTFYVRTDGHDSNTGLENSEEGAFLTLQGAWNHIAQNVDLAGFIVTVQIADGTYTAGVDDSNKPAVGGRVNFRGNVDTPANVVIAATTEDCFKAAHSEVGVTGVTLTNSGGSGLHAFRQGVISIGPSVVFGACSEMHIFCDNAGQIVVGANYRVVGNSPIHWGAHTTGTILAATRNVSIADGLTIDTWAYALIGGAIEAAEMTFSLDDAEPVGRKFIAENGGIINTRTDDLDFFPGSMPGELWPNGIYDEVKSSDLVGSFTPHYRGVTTEGATTETVSGRYVKAGARVYIDGMVAWSAANGTGQACITGLPYAPSGDGVIAATYSGVTAGAGKTLALYISSGQLRLYANDPAGGSNASVPVEAAGDIRFSGFYFTAA